jgi:hypothetical protein
MAQVSAVTSDAASTVLMAVYSWARAPSEEGHVPDLSAMLERGPVVCAEGTCSNASGAGTSRPGRSFPEVVLDHPEVVTGLHREPTMQSLRDPARGGAQAFPTSLDPSPAPARN